jgi:aminopeptidase N
MRVSRVWSPIIALATLVSAGAQTGDREQLPPGVTPIHYDLWLAPDAANLKFRGQVRITIEVQKWTSALVLNAAELTLDKAVLDAEPATAGIQPDSHLQRATLTFAHPVAAGRHTVTIDYHGTISSATDGFFAMDYDSPAGKRRTVLTDFEPANERRFMPSWDEPELKATFNVTADVPAELMAVSNMPVASTEDLGGGLKRVHFAVTPKMSTYLLFLGIGDFERIDTMVDGTDVGVVVTRGGAEKGKYALAEAARILHFYNDYFGVPYPLPKLDLVAAPGQTGGAMENWGAILYSQKTLLFDPKSSTEGERQGVFHVVAHEMSHQWFGDLVTMAWWDDLWLNEGFADWIQTKATDELHPEWKTGLYALAADERGKQADSRASTHPIVQPVLTINQAELAFDDITYAKGSAVIGMLEAYAGAGAFREGIRRYVRAHAYGNTVDADLWREVQASAGKPILKPEADFTRQPGVPMIKVDAGRTSGGRTSITVSEGRFAEDPAAIASAPAQTWRIPITVSAGARATTELLSARAHMMLAGTGPVIVNAGQSSYVRVLYSPAMIAELRRQFASLTAADQFGILCDTWALGKSGYAPITNFLDLARAVPAGADPMVWHQIVDTLREIDRHYEDSPGHAAFTAFARGMLAPLAKQLGWDAEAKEDSNTAILRAALLEALSRFGDERVVAEARRRFDLALEDPHAVSPDARRTALSIVARHADGATLDRLIAMRRSARDPLEKQDILEALADIADPAGAQRILEVVSADDPAGVVAAVLTRIASNHPDLAWNFALRNVDQPGFPLLTGQRLHLMPTIASWSNDPQRLADLRSYASAHLPPEAGRNVEAVAAAMNLNMKFKTERLPEIDRWLASIKPTQ